MPSRKAKLTKAEYDALSSDVEKGFYRPEGQSYVPDITPADGWALEDVAGLRTALQEVNEKFRRHQAKWAPFDNLDPTAIQEALDHKKNFDPAKYTPKDALDNAINGVKAENARVVSAKDAEIKKLQEQVRRGLVDGEIQRVLSQKGQGTHGSFELLRGPIAERVRVDEVNGNYEVRVLDERGNPRVSSGNASTYMGIEEYVKNHVAKDSKYKPAFYDEGKPGGSTQPGSPGGPGDNKQFQLTESQARDGELYRRTREAAVKAGAMVTVVPDAN